MSNPTCTPASLRVNCFTCLSLLQRKAMMVYLAAAELKGIGGTDYTALLTSTASGGLIGAATQGLQQVNRDLLGTREIGLYELGIALNNAVASTGANSTDSINTRMQQIKCLINVDERTLDMMLVWLTCNLGVHKSYAQ